MSRVNEANSSGTWVFSNTREQSRNSMKSVLNDAKVRTREIKATYSSTKHSSKAR